MRYHITTSVRASGAVVARQQASNRTQADAIMDDAERTLNRGEQVVMHDMEKKDNPGAQIRVEYRPTIDEIRAQADRAVDRFAARFIERGTAEIADFQKKWEKDVANPAGDPTYR